MSWPGGSTDGAAMGPAAKGSTGGHRGTAFSGTTSVLGGPAATPGSGATRAGDEPGERAQASENADTSA